MSIIDAIFGPPAIRKLPQHERAEVNQLLADLVKIGQQEDFLSLSPGGSYNIHCHHLGARRIGQRLNELGGLELMFAARDVVKRKLKAVLAEHLDYCWQGIGSWQA